MIEPIDPVLQVSELVVDLLNLVRDSGSGTGVFGAVVLVVEKLYLRVEIVAPLLLHSQFLFEVHQAF
jgi:hypothetical protein